MRILLVCQNIGEPRNGWSVYTHLLADALRARGHEIIFCCQSTDPSFSSETQFAILRNPLDYLANPFAALLTARRFRGVVNNTRPDVVHVTVSPYVTILPFIRPSIFQRCVSTIHGSYGIRLLQHIVSRRLELRCYRDIAQFIAVSEYTKNHVVKAVDALNSDIAEALTEKTTVITNGIALPSFTAPRPPGMPRRILLVGGVKARKGILEALRGCAAYKKKYRTPFRFVIAGIIRNKDYVRAVGRHLREYNLTEEVILLGQIGDARLEEEYRRADVYLMPALTTYNTFEGFGIVFLEANSHGLPCIGPNDGGSVEAIAEGRSGYHVNPSNAADIAEKLHWILDENRISSNTCRAWAEEHTIDRMTDATIGIYESVAKKAAIHVF